MTKFDLPDTQPSYDYHAETSKNDEFENKDKPKMDINVERETYEKPNRKGSNEFISRFEKFFDYEDEDEDNITMNPADLGRTIRNDRPNPIRFIEIYCETFLFD